MPSTVTLDNATKVIKMKKTDTATITVTVKNVRVPYTIALDGTAVIHSMVNRRESTGPLSVGTHRLGWAFTHVLSSWSHNLSIKVGNKTTSLEKASEANKDTPYSVGVAFIEVT